MHNRVDNPNEIKHCDFHEGLPKPAACETISKTNLQRDKKVPYILFFFWLRASLPREGCPRDMARKWQMSLCPWSEADSCPGRTNSCQMAKLMLFCAKHGSWSLASCTDCQDRLGLLVTGRAPPGWKWWSVERGVYQTARLESSRTVLKSFSVLLLHFPHEKKRRKLSVIINH